ncbi:DNA N-glycosylase and apurinic/apyrimidinic (AP) lyase [Tulasnella sp. JGI-2019a]|nr:DNA N-glycosylase and apurinic/apyrimidinic (AP) lyase [Tulasnella sp. JGI-2019a]
MSGLVKKRRLSTPEQDSSAAAVDVEDAMMPTSSSKIRGVASAFTYTGRSTRSASKRLKSEALEASPAPVEDPQTLSPLAKTKMAVSVSPRKSKPIQIDLAVPHLEPKNWEKVYNIIKDMRKEIVAPVDTMGCASAMLEEAEPKIQRFGTLISLMLSSQTKDAVTSQALANLRTALGQLTVENLINADDAIIGAAIAKVGFWRRKTGYIKQAAQILKDKYDSDVPKTIDELCSLPGVGPKMSFLLLQAAWDINIGIGVDVHVHRITNRLGWHKPPTTTPEQTRLNLQSWLPKDLHPEINPLLVGFGQMICLPIGPKCDECSLSSQGLCPSARKITSPRKPKPASPTKVKTKDEVLERPDSIVVFPKLEVAHVVKGDDEGDVGHSSRPRVAIELEPSASATLPRLFPDMVKTEDG